MHVQQQRNQSISCTMSLLIWAYLDVVAMSNHSMFLKYCLNFYTHPIVEKYQIAGLPAQVRGPHFEQLWAGASCSRESWVSGWQPGTRASIPWHRESKALSQTILAWEAAQWQEMAQLGDNSSGDKEKEGTKTETRVKEELIESDGKWEIAKVLCLDNEWSGAAISKNRNPGGRTGE